MSVWIERYSYGVPFQLCEEVRIEYRRSVVAWPDDQIIVAGNETRYLELPGRVGLHSLEVALQQAFLRVSVHHGDIRNDRRLVAFHDGSGDRSGPKINGRGEFNDAAFFRNV